MKNCSFSCNHATDGKYDKNKNVENSEYAMPIMKFNYDKEVDEYKNLIIQLLSTSFNIKINNLLKNSKHPFSSSFLNKICNINYNLDCKLIHPPPL